MIPPWRLREYDSLPSTSDLCITLAQAGEPERLAILAGRQTAGRGSRGRTWSTRPGNLAVSVLLRPDHPADAAGQWALLAAVALAEALESCGAPKLGLKWPNDILLDGKKLGGILLDTGLEQRRLAWLVIGLGANLATAPDLPTATRLPTPIPPLALARTLLDRLDDWLSLLHSSSPGLTRGSMAQPARPAAPWTPGSSPGVTSGAPTVEEAFAPVRRAWLACGPAQGTPIRLSTGEHGTFAGLSPAGALLLQSGGHTRAFSTGDVLLESASP